MVDQGTVSVVVPTYNRRDLLLQAVSSVLVQTYPNIICTVVDNGSADGTVEALRSLRDPRLRILIEERAMGGAAARNVGIESSDDSTWVAFLDSDDLWAPDKLERQLEAVSANPHSAWSATACLDVGPGLDVRYALRLVSGEPVGCRLFNADELEALLMEENLVPAGNSTVLVSRALLQKVGGYDPSLFTCDDWELWIRMAKESALTYLDAPLTAYRIWDGQSSSDATAFLRDAATVRSRHFPGSGALPRSYAARWAREVGRREVAAGRRLSAARSYLRAAKAGRAPGQLAYSLAVILAPKVVERRLRRVEGSGRLPEGWAEEAEAWLARWRAV